MVSAAARPPVRRPAAQPGGSRPSVAVVAAAATAAAPRRRPRKHRISDSRMKEFKTVRRLGKGSFGQVWLVKRLCDETSYAMKRMNLHKVHKDVVAAALNEVRLLASLRHPNVVG